MHGDSSRNLSIPAAAALRRDLLIGFRYWLKLRFFLTQPGDLVTVRLQ